jgi:predicted nucleotidyltransferase
LVLALVAEAPLAPIVAVFLVGSYARGAAGPDSDVDLVILSGQPGEWLRDTSWAARFGVVERTRAEDWGAVRSLRVWYAGALEVEFGFAAPAWLNLPLDPGTRAVLEAGYLLLYDPSGWAAGRLTQAGLVP